MKNRSISILLAFLIVIAAMPMKAEKVYSESAGLYDLKINTTYRHDITGDSEPDNLSVTAKVRDGYVSGFAVNINGTTVLTKYDPNVVSESPAEEYYPTIQYIVLENGQPLLYIHLTSANGYYGGGWVYKYESGSVEELLDTQDLIDLYKLDCSSDYEDWWRPYEVLDSLEGNSICFKIGWTADPSREKGYICRYNNGILIVDKESFVLSGKTFKQNLDFYAENLSTSQFDNGLCSLMAAIANCSGSKSSVSKMHKTLGLEDIFYDNYDDPGYFVSNRDGITYSIGCKRCSNGKKILLISIRGTGNTSDINHDLNVTNFSDDNFYVHEGFRKAADYIEKNLFDLLGGEPEPDPDVKYFITGHSLGAAAGNLIAADLSTLVGKDSVYNYNFACPNTVTSTESILDNPNAYNPMNSHSNMFNICRATDRVPSLPGLESSMLLEAKEYGQYWWDPFQCFHTKHDYYWGKLGITKWFDDGILALLEAHDMGKYLDYVSRKNPKYTTTPTYGDNYTYVMNNVFVFCPVDVELIDSNGKVIAAITNNKPVYYNNSEGSVYISTVGDRKCISYPSNRNYKIKLKGTNAGSMSYIIAQGAPSEDLYSKSVIYENVSLTTNKRMRGIIDNKKIDNSRLYGEDAGGNVKTEIHADGTEIPHKHSRNKTYTVERKATCTSTGVESLYCSKCGDKISGTTRVIPKVAHKFAAWIITPATEIASGKKVRTCSVCGNTETKTIAKLKPSLKAVKILKPKAAKKSATVKWKKISKKNLKKIKKVQIQYSTDKKFKKGVKTKYASAKKTSYKIKGLKKGKKYYVRIRAYTKSGKTVHVSKWSAKKNFKAK